MCLARDALHYVMRFGVVRFMLTSILDGKYVFKQGEVVLVYMLISSGE